MVFGFQQLDNEALGIAVKATDGLVDETVLDGSKGGTRIGTNDSSEQENKLTLNLVVVCTNGAGAVKGEADVGVTTIEETTNNAEGPFEKLLIVFDESGLAGDAEKLGKFLLIKLRLLGNDGGDEEEDGDKSENEEGDLHSCVVVGIEVASCLVSW